MYELPVRLRSTGRGFTLLVLTSFVLLLLLALPVLAVDHPGSWITGGSSSSLGINRGLNGDLWLGQGIDNPSSPSLPSALSSIEQMLVIMATLATLTATIVVTTASEGDILTRGASLLVGGVASIVVFIATRMVLGG